MRSTRHPTRLWSHPSGRSSLGCPHHSRTLPPPSASLLLHSPPAPPLCPPLPLASAGRCTQTWRGPSGRCSARWWCQRSSCSLWAQRSCWAMKARRLPGGVGFVFGPDARPWGRSAWSGLVGSAHWPRWSPWCRRWFLVYCGDRGNKAFIPTFWWKVSWMIRNLKSSYQVQSCAKGKSFRGKWSHLKPRVVGIHRAPLPSCSYVVSRNLAFCTCVFGSITFPKVQFLQAC